MGVVMFGLILPMVGCRDDGGESTQAASDETEVAPTTGGTGATSATTPATTAGASPEESAPADDSAPSGTLVVGLERDPELLDPNFARHVVAESVGQALFDALVMVDLDGELVPGLAESYEYLDDLTLEFVLREGISFHNGEPFNADVVKFTVERMQDEAEGSHLLEQFASIDEVEIVDDYNVVFHLSTPDAPLLQSLTRLMMVPPAYYTEVGHDGFEASPVGTGPFKFVSYTSEDETVLDANLEYWKGSPKGVPLVEQVVFRVIPETATRVAELTTGGIQLARALTPDQTSVIEDAGMTALSYPDGRASSVLINATNKGESADAATGEDARAFEALTDVRVRQALNYAIDREAVVSSLYDGESIPLGQPFAPNGFGYDPENEPYRYDPEMARQLLEEAGFGDGLTVDLVATNTSSTDELNAIIGYLEDVGVAAELELTDASVFNERLLGGVFAPARYSIWNQPETFLDLLVETDGLVSVYSNPEVDALIDKQRVTIDVEERTQVLKEITDLLREDPCAIYLWSVVNIVGVDDTRTAGFVPHPRGWIPVTNVSIMDG